MPKWWSARAIIYKVQLGANITRASPFLKNIVCSFRVSYLPGHSPDIILFPKSQSGFSLGEELYHTQVPLCASDCPYNMFTDCLECLPWEEVIQWEKSAWCSKSSFTIEARSGKIYNLFSFWLLPAAWSKHLSSASFNRIWLVTSCSERLQFSECVSSLTHIHYAETLGFHFFILFFKPVDAKCFRVSFC